MSGHCLHRRHDQCAGCDCACHRDKFLEKLDAAWAAALKPEPATPPPWAGNISKQHRPRRA